MAGHDDPYYEIDGKLRVPKGTTPDRSKKTEGALRATARDANRHLVTQAEFLPRTGDDSDSDAYSEQFLEDDAKDDAPDISRLVTVALVAGAGVAVGVAGVKFAQHVKSQREIQGSKPNSIASASAPPAGWYEVASDSGQLRYWDGTAWTNDFAQRHSAGAMPVDWYPDPSNAAQLRYWDGVAWTHHFAPKHSTAAIPADWYPDPSNAAQLRYWDGVAWTHHVAPSRGQAVVAPQPVAAPHETRRVSGSEEPRIRMSSAEWQELVRAWIAAGAIGEELWRRLSNAHIEDADDATLQAQRGIEQLTSQQGAHRIKLMLEANPALCEEFALPEFMKFFRGGHSVVDRGVPASIERANESRRPTSGRMNHRPDGG